MRILPGELPGLAIIEADPRIDIRGSFTRLCSNRQLAASAMAGTLSEASLSANTLAHTLRGMHFQRHPHGECKLVQVLRGAIFDVAVDLRPGSPTRGKWSGVELSRSNWRGLYIPEGFAHGFLTLEDKTDVLYHITDTFAPEAATGFAWNDPAVGIKWPFPPAVISERDASLPQLALAPQ